MITVLQRVSRAEVRVDGEVVGAIGVGLVLLVGVEHGDTDAEAIAMAQKIAGLRVFPGRTPMDRDLAEVGGACLVVSQFTLAGSVRKGRRPSFDAAARSDLAAPLVERVADELRRLGLRVETGRFGAMMEVEMVGQGPVTLILRVTERAVL
jgi:D-tyrosyl-tRNA(Tyr) deacylase